MQEIQCPGCARLYRFSSNVDVTVETERRADNNYRLHIVGAADAAWSTVDVYVEDVELAQSYSERSGPFFVLGGGDDEGPVDPSVRGERLTMIHECVPEAAIRQLEALLECPHCHETFSYEDGGEGGLPTEEPLRVEWETLYDERLRAWSVGMWIMPDEAAIPRYPFRTCVHECEPVWPNEVTRWHEPPDDVGGDPTHEA